ncbi:sensor histidine kinase [Georgenia alba]|uniref:histidine kinase n=1 Tax=Georgenia alba TaxID=2233858 RepID=A0ABW2Q9X4_9MICO
MERVAARRPWATVAATAISAAVVVAVGSLWLRGRSVEVMYGLFVLHNAPTALMLSWVGRLVVRRRPGNPIGRLLLVVAALGAAHVVVAALADVGMVQWGHSAPIPTVPDLIPARMPAAASVPLWFMNWLWLPQVVLLVTVLPAIFPDGHLPGPRWRFVLRLGAAGGVLALAGLVVDGWPAADWAVGSEPVVVPLLLLPGFALLAAATLGALAAMVVRWRHTAADQRRPFQVVGTAVTLLAVLCLATYPWPWMWTPTSLVALQLVLLAYALAVARLRVHDLEPVLARRTVVVGLSVVVTALVAAAIVAVGWVAARMSDNDLLPLVAVGLVALGVEPVRRVTSRLITRAVYHLGTDHTQVVSQMAAQASAGAATDLLAGVVDVLRRATGSARAEAWLREHGELVLAATSGREGAFGTVLAAPVVSHDEQLGELRLLADVPGDLPRWSHQLLADVSHITAAALYNARLSAALEHQLVELRSSRRRLVEAQDAARRSIERDLHDGAQAQLIALRLRLAVIQAALPAPGDLAADLGEVAAGIDGAVDTLRVLAHGLQPPILDQAGVAAALRAHARGLPVPVDVSADGVARYDAAIESAVYFACLEAIQNALKHSGAGRIQVELSVDGGTLTFSVRDDGVGFDRYRTDDDRATSGLVNIGDRLAAVGGTLTIESGSGDGARICGSVPVPDLPSATGSSTPRPPGP